MKPVTITRMLPYEYSKDTIVLDKIVEDSVNELLIQNKHYLEPFISIKQQKRSHDYGYDSGDTFIELSIDVNQPQITQQHIQYEKMMEHLRGREQTLLMDPVVNKKRLNEIQYLIKTFATHI